MAVLGKKEEGVETPKEKNTIIIKDRKYQIVPLKHNDGLLLINYIMKVILPSVGSGFDNLAGGSEYEDSTTFLEAMIHLSNRMEADFLITVSDTILQGATVDGEVIDDAHFSGNYGAWRSLIQFALTENFASFFEGGLTQVAGDLIKLVTPQMQQA